MKNNLSKPGNYSFVRKLNLNKILLRTGFLFLIYGTALLNAGAASESPDTLNEKAFQNIGPDERVVMITDRSLYLCGENIVFIAFTYDGKMALPVPMSSILYVEFYGQDNRVISQEKFVMKNGRVSGSVNIPRDIATDFYHIRAYTNYMKNFGYQQFFTRRLKIVNPFKNSSGIKLLQGHGINNTNEEDSLNCTLNIPLEKFKIEVSTDKMSYGNRENVDVLINCRNKDGIPVKSNLIVFASLSGEELDKTEKYSELIPLTPNDSVGKGLKNIRLDYLPEISGDIVAGKLVYKDGKPAAGIEVLQSFTGSSTCLESSITDRNGGFYFLINDQKNKGDLIYEVNNPKNSISIIPDEEFYSGFPQIQKENISFSKDEIDLIYRQFINVQVTDAYMADDKIPAETQGKSDYAFYGSLFDEYRFTEFAKLPNMKEFIFEFITGVVLSKEGKQDVIEIFDKENFTKIGPHPLMVMDGVPVGESSVITNLPPEKVESVRVVRNKYFYKNKVWDGIMDIITYSKDASSFVLPEGTSRFNFLHAKEENINIEPVLMPADSGRIPLYRDLLYWNSNIYTDDEGKSHASFLTPDNSGNFTIQCFSLTEDGLTGAGNVTIKVGKN